MAFACRRMAAGRPVLVAKGLAWDHLPALNAGWVFERNEESVLTVLQKALVISDSEWLALSNNARSYVEKHLNPVTLGEQVWQVLTSHELAMNQSVTAGVGYE